MCPGYHQNIAEHDNIFQYQATETKIVDHYKRNLSIFNMNKLLLTK